MDDVERVNWVAMGDDIVLDGGIAAVCVAECGAGFDLIDVEAAV